jgi:hypothetical protein
MSLIYRKSINLGPFMVNLSALVSAIPWSCGDSESVRARAGGANVKPGPIPFRQGILAKVLDYSYFDV